MKLTLSNRELDEISQPPLGLSDPATWAPIHHPWADDNGNWSLKTTDGWTHAGMSSAQLIALQEHLNAIEAKKEMYHQLLREADMVWLPKDDK